MPDPLWYRFNGIAMMPLQLELAQQQFRPDGRYLLEAHHERSYAQHKAYFASLTEAWRSLSTDKFPSPEHLRKHALIACGWRDERAFACRSRAEATRLATFCKPFDDYAVMIADGTVLRVWTAQSQSYKAMGRDKFTRSIDDVLSYVANLIGVSKELLQAQGEFP